MELPFSLTNFGLSPFQNCVKLTGCLTIQESLDVIPDSLFEGLSGLNGTLTIPKQITKIGDYSFAGCSGFTGDLIFLMAN